MNRNLNRSAYKQLEISWSSALKNGSEVKVNVSPIYSGNSLRPDVFNIDYSIDGLKFQDVFKNVYGGK